MSLTEYTNWQDGRIDDLEKKLAEANTEIEILDRRNKIQRDYFDAHVESEKKLAIAKEALEFINTYKSPDYVNLPRGSVFDVSREALKQLSEQSLEKKLKDCGVGII